jgi:hypothetical protein
MLESGHGEGLEERKQHTMSDSPRDHLRSFGPPFQIIIFMLQRRRRTRVALVVVRDEADDFGNKADRSGGLRFKAKPLQCEFKDPCVLRSGLDGRKKIRGKRKGIYGCKLRVGERRDAGQ